MLEYIVGFIVGYLFAVIYGLDFIFRLIIRFVKNPFRPFWTVRNREIPPQCLISPALGRHRYVQIKDVKLHYVEAGDQSKPLMLLLHGFPECWYSWRHQLKEFSSDYWMVAVDMRGYGDSDKPIGNQHYKNDLLISDIKDLITALGKKRCTIVGHDWGGCIAWFLVLTEPQMFDSYIMMNSLHPEVYYEHLNKSVSQFRKSWYILFFLLPWLPELWLRMDDLQGYTDLILAGSVKSPPNISDEDIEAYKYYYSKPRAFTFPINYYRANFLSNAKDQLHGLGTNLDFPPGLILFGDRDVYLDKEIQEETIKRIANSTLVYIKDANHFVQQDDPATVNSHMKNFLNKSRARGK